MRNLKISGMFGITALILIGSCFAYPKARTSYVDDFVFPSDEKHVPRSWEQLTDKSTESRDHNDDVKSWDKCRDFHIDYSSGKVCLIFISYTKLEDPLQSLNKALVEDLNLPELVYSLRVVKRGKRRLVFELPSAIDAFLTLNSYCKLYHDRHDRTYEILNVEEDLIF
ncbi:hypothetical protein KR084_005610 [Drosophila pseudotakahashii]|nr:hypothetical protein KR084_005610 [Drosophila pseudotakahashii]